MLSKSRTTCIHLNNRVPAMAASNVIGSAVLFFFLEGGRGRQLLCPRLTNCMSGDLFIRCEQEVSASMLGKPHKSVIPD